MTPQPPKRIQLRRSNGWRKPAGAVVVARPSRWGNPFSVSSCPSELCGPRGTRWHYYDPAIGALSLPFPSRAEAVSEAVRRFREGVLDNDSDRYDYLPRVDEIRAELAGKDLACWCRLDSECHGDALLAISNGWEIV